MEIKILANFISKITSEPLPGMLLAIAGGVASCGLWTNYLKQVQRKDE
jgi:hypothetical protein